MRRGILSKLLVLLLWAACCPAALAQWQITEFELFQGEPSKEANWLEVEREYTVVPLTQSLKDDTELFLQEVASKLSKLQFADPVANGYLDSVVTRDDGTRAIRVYLYDPPFSNTPYAWYSSGIPCTESENPRRIMNINSSWYAKGGSISDMNYQTLAHELFHAVQYSSEYMERFHCSGPRWLNEGTADAIGIYLAKELRDAKFKDEYTPGNNQILKVVGARKYSTPLHLPDSSTSHDYMTSSFWRYLAEESYASMHGEDLVGAAKTGEDYQYLANFFNKPFDIHRGPVAQLNWLDRRMKGETHIRGNLAHLFPRFASRYADYMDARISDKLGGNNESRNHGWLVQGFANCYSAATVGAGSSSTYKVSIRPIAARCFKVNVEPGALKKFVYLQVMHEDKSVLGQLRIGLPDGSDVRPPVVLSQENGQPPHFALWTFPHYFANDGTYIVTNVAETPRETKTADLTFNLSMSDWQADMITLPPRPVKKRPPKRDRPPTRKDEQKEELKKVLENPAENLEPVTKVTRKEDKGSCQGTERQLNLCGPQLNIKLSLSPLDINLDVAPATGFFSEVVDIMAVDVSNPLGNMNQYYGAFLETEQALESMDASEITISIPLVDYGFTGSFDNAHIEVYKAGKRRRNYQAYGPPVATASRTYWAPPTGKVTITQYSPMAIEGTFSAGLVDEDELESRNNPVVSKRISGSFFVPAPLLHDDRYQMAEEPLKQQMIQQMMQQAPFGTEVMNSIVQGSGASPSLLCEYGVDEEQIKAMGFEQGCANYDGSTIAERCTCECDRREQEEALLECESYCQSRWNHCPLPDEQVTDELAAQVEIYRERLAAKGYPENLQDQFVENFKKMPQWERDMTLQAFK